MHFVAEPRDIPPQFGPRRSTTMTSGLVLDQPRLPASSLLYAGHRFVLRNESIYSFVALSQCIDRFSRNFDFRSNSEHKSIRTRLSRDTRLNLNRLRNDLLRFICEIWFVKVGSRFSVWIRACRVIGLEAKMVRLSEGVCFCFGFHVRLPANGQGFSLS